MEEESKRELIKKNKRLKAVIIFIICLNVFMVGLDIFLTNQMIKQNDCYIETDYDDNVLIQ